MQDVDNKVDLQSWKLFLEVLSAGLSFKKSGNSIGIFNFFVMGDDISADLYLERFDDLSQVSSHLFILS